MQQFIRRNARTAALLNLVINAVIPAGIMWSATSVSLRGSAPNFFTLLLPAVGISALATTVATFATLPGRPVGIGWLPVAVANSVGIGLLFAAPVAGALLLAQSALTTDVVVGKPVALVLSSLTGAAVAALASLLAVRRAALYFHVPLNAVAAAQV